MTGLNTRDLKFADTGQNHRFAVGLIPGTGFSQTVLKIEERDREIERRRKLREERRLPGRF